MPRQTPVKKELFASTLKRMVLGVLVGIFGCLGLALAHPQLTSAATADTINFQAKLMTAGGAIAADGDYNVEFNLYSQATNGSSLWSEDRLNQNGTGVHVANGYLTVDLGSVNPFPSTINWDQNLWIGMTVRGTGSCSFSTTCSPMDQEMTPRLKLTAVPYAMSAGNLSNVNGSIKSTLTFQGGTGGDQQFVLPDQGAAGTYNILTSANAGSFVQLQASTPGNPQTGSFNINGTGIAGILQAGQANIIVPSASKVGLTVQAAASQTGDLLQFKGSNGTSVLSGFDNSGSLFFKDQTSGYETKIAIQANSTAKNQTLYIPALSSGAVATICTTSGNCVGNGGAGDVFKGGQSGPLVIGTTDATDLTFITGNTSREVITGAGNVGIGISTANPAQLLSVGGSTGNFTVDSTGQIVTAGGIQAAGTGKFKVSASTGYVTVALSTDSTGATPVCQNGNGLLSGCATSGNGAAFVQGGNTFSAQGVLGTQDNYGLAIMTNNTNRITIDPTGYTTFAGNVGIGTTGAPAANLTVQATADTSPALALLNPDGTTAVEFRTGGSGKSNLYIGLNSGGNSTTASGNVSLGAQALQHTTTGGNNVALGLTALAANTTGYDNVAIGKGSLAANQAGNYNFALGAYALRVSTGSENIGIGASSLWSNTSGGNNLGIGYNALYTNTTGSNNIAIGYQADVGSAALQNAIAIGANATVSQSNSLVLGGTGVNAVSVGIGTSTPAYTLDVAGNVNASQSIYTNATERLDSGGNLKNIGNITATGQATLGGGTDQAQVIIKANSAQTANLFELQNSSGDILTHNTADGQLVLGTVGITTGTAVAGSIGLSDGTTDGFLGTIVVSTLNQSSTYTLPDPGAAGTATICLENSTDCGFALATDLGSYVQFAPAAAQEDASTNSSIFINKTGASGNLIQLQAAGTDEFVVKNNGDSSITGKLGVGMATPGYQLDVTGDINTSGYYRQGGSIVINANNSSTLNSFFGVNSGNTTTTGIENTSVGAAALKSNTTGGFNTAVGAGSLATNTTGTENTANGNFTLNANTTGSDNTATGAYALYKNTTGIMNNASGDGALAYNTSGNYNTATGYQAGFGVSGSSDVTGNALFGYEAGHSLQTGADYNTLLGYSAGSSLTTGAHNILIGDNIQSASATGSYQLNIGNAIYGDLSTGKIGIGTSAPVTTLDVNGATSRGYASNFRSYQNVFGYKDTSGSDTGTFAIVLPNGWTSTMMTATINGYDYASGAGAWQVVVSGYNLNSGSPGWTNTSARISGHAPFNSVRLGYDGTHVVILLGTTATTWHYPQIAVSEFDASQNSVDSWGSGWSGSFVTDESGYSGIVSVGTQQLATTDEVFLQGGNSFGATAVLGTNDSQDLQFQTDSTTRFTIDAAGTASFTGNVGIGTATPAALFSVGSSSQFKVDNSGNETSAGITTGVINASMIRAAGTSNTTFGIQNRNFTAAGTMVQTSTGTFSNTSGTSVGFAIQPTYNQVSSTAANTDLLINRTQTSVGSGAQLLIDAQVGGVSKFSVDTGGDLTTSGTLHIGTSGMPANVSGAYINTGGTTSSYYALQVGSGVGNILSITNAGNVGVGTSAPSALFSVGSSSQFQVNGSGNITAVLGANTTNGALVCQDTTTKTLSACDTSYEAPTATNFIQNQYSTAQTGNFFIQSADAGQATAVIQGATSQTADILDIEAASGATKVLHDGSLAVTSGANTTFVVNNTTQNVGIGVAAPVAKLDVSTSSLVAGQFNQTGASDILDLLSSGTAVATFDAQGNATINGTVKGGQVIVTGAKNQAQLIVKANSAQSAVNPLIALQDASGNELARISAPDNTDLYIGYLSGTQNSGANENTSLGTYTMYYNTTGQQNAALGYGALLSNTTGSNNTSTGAASLFYNTSGAHNTANGDGALYNNSTGSNNTAIGYATQQTNTTGSQNTNIGYYSNVGANNLQNSTAIGAYSYVSASNSLVLGCVAGVGACPTTTNIGIGNSAPAALLSVGSSSQFRVNMTGNIQAPTLDTVSGSLGIGGTNATSVIIGHTAGNIQTTVTGDLVVGSGNTGSGTAFRIQNSSTTLLTADTSAQVVKIGTTTTAQQPSDSLIAANTEVQGTIFIGNSSGSIKTTSAGGPLRYTGSARQTIKDTLTPEYAGATMSGDGSNNVGTMTSDFCSNTSPAVNTSVCNAAGNVHNYYSWTTGQTTAQDYDIFTRWQVPSNFDSSQTPSVSFYGWRSTTGETVTLTIYNAAGTTCGTGSISTTGGWSSVNLTGVCAMNPGDMLTLDAHLGATTGNTARVGEITINYYSDF